MAEAHFRCPFHQDRDVITDGTVVEQGMFLGNYLLDDRALLFRKALGEPVRKGQERFGFSRHPQSFDLPGRGSQHSLICRRQRAIPLPSRQGDGSLEE